MSTLILGGGAGPSLREAVAGVTGLVNCRLILDIADLACFPGSGETIADISGQANDFWNGIGATTANNMVFVGTAGDFQIGTYFRADGEADWGTMKVKPTWIDAFHKNNAQWSFYVCFYSVGSGGIQGVFGNADSTLNSIGVVSYIDDDDDVVVSIANGSGSAARRTEIKTNVTHNQWHRWGASIDEGGGASASHHIYAGTQNTFNGSYTSPSSSPASNAMEICALGDGGDLAPDTLSRFGCLAMWNTNISITQMKAVDTIMAGRYPN